MVLTSVQPPGGRGWIEQPCGAALRCLPSLELVCRRVFRRDAVDAWFERGYYEPMPIIWAVHRGEWTLAGPGENTARRSTCQQVTEQALAVSVLKALEVVEVIAGEEDAGVVVRETGIQVFRRRLFPRPSVPGWPRLGSRLLTRRSRPCALGRTSWSVPCTRCVRPCWRCRRISPRRTPLRHREVRVNRPWPEARPVGSGRSSSFESSQQFNSLA